MIRRLALTRDERGVGAVEFALIAPVLLAFIIGISQLGLLFMANAGLRNAVAEGARLAAIYPTPSNEAILERITDREFGLDPDHLTQPEIAHDRDANGNPFATITMAYDVPLSFVFVEVPPVTLTETRRVYTQPLAAAASGASDESGSTATATSTSDDGWGDESSETDSTTSTSPGNGQGHGHGHGRGG